MLALIALVDHFVLFFPVDAFLLSATFIQPKKWWQTALWFCAGSTLGIYIFFYLVRDFGLPVVTYIAPAMVTGSLWITLTEFFTKYGLWVVFGSAFSSIPQQPAAAIGALSEVSFAQFALVYLVGRAAKYLGLCALAAFFPDLLKKIWKPKPSVLRE